MASYKFETIDDKYRDILYAQCAEQNNERLSNFLETHNTVATKTTRKFNYEMLDTLLIEMGLTFPQGFKLITQQTIAIPSEVKAIRKRLSHITEAQKENMLYATQLMLPWWARFDNLYMYKPSRNIIIACEAWKKTGKQLPESVLSLKSLSKALADRKFSTRIDFQDIPFIASEMRLSLHWVYYPLKIMYSRNTLDQKILDVYFMLDDDIKTVFLETLLNTEGEL